VRVSFASDAARHILGMAPKNGDPLVEFVKRVPATHRRRLLSTFWRAVEAGERFEFEIPFQRTEQERRWLLGEATPDAERTGMVTGVLIDITRRKESEQDFRRSERRFRALVEQAVDVVAIFDLDGDIQYLSPSVERVTGRSREELVHTSAFALAHEEDRDRLQKAFGRAAQSPGIPVEVEGRIRHADGTDREIAIRARRVTGPGGESQVIANIRDVTSERRYRRELIAAKEEAEEASQLKSAMIANMSHEVRTPLTSILGFAEILAEADLGSPNDRFVQMIDESGTRLLRTLNAMLDLSRLESGAADVTPHPTEAVAVAWEMVASLRPQAETAGVSITVDLPDTEIHVHADLEILRTILRNLIGNAIKFTPNGGTVDVRVHRGAGAGDRPEPEPSTANGRRESVVFEIEDTGIGMEPSFAEEALKPFRQESVGDNREYEGSGLGLAIVDRYVRLLDGSIAIDTKKGEGTCVRVILPGSSEADLSAPGAPSS
jgi:PAS domain S-box-containing protein